MGSITSAMCVSFKKEVLEGIHDFRTTGNTFKIALIKASPTGDYDEDTTAYSDVTGNSDEASGTGYSAGGATLSKVNPSTDGSAGLTDFGDPSWTGTFSADGAIIYNDSAAGDPAVAVLSFGGTVSVVGGTLTLSMPAAAAATAIIRLD